LVLDRLSVALALPVFVVAALTLAACGRNGPPLPPPDSTPAPTTDATPPAGPSPTGAVAGTGPTAQQTAQKNGFDTAGNPVAPPGQKKSFLLDPLLQ
jgi:predicted small lipoprotein YifL